MYVIGFSKYPPIIQHCYFGGPFPHSHQARCVAPEERQAAASMQWREIMCEWDLKFIYHHLPMDKSWKDHLWILWRIIYQWRGQIIWTTGCRAAMMASRPEDVPPPPDPPRPRTERLGMSRINKRGSQWMSVPFKTAHSIGIIYWGWRIPMVFGSTTGDPHGFWINKWGSPWFLDVFGHPKTVKTRPVSSAGLRVLARLRREAEPCGPQWLLSQIFSPKAAVWRCLEGFVFWKGVIWDFKGWWSQETWSFCWGSSRPSLGQPRTALCRRYSCCGGGSEHWR